MRDADADRFEIMCDHCDAVLWMVQLATGRWLAVEPWAQQVSVSLPRRPIHVVTEGGELVAGFEPAPDATRVGYPVHWPRCQRQQEAAMTAWLRRMPTPRERCHG
jgi:hypothetical protein